MIEGAFFALGKPMVECETGGGLDRMDERVPVLSLDTANGLRFCFELAVSRFTADGMLRCPACRGGSGCCWERAAEAELALIVLICDSFVDAFMRGLWMDSGSCGIIARSSSSDFLSASFCFFKLMENPFSSLGDWK